MGILSGVTSIIGNVNVPTGSSITGTDTGSVYAPGSVLQVVSFNTTDTGSITLATSDLALSPDITVDITPKASGSHFLIQARWNGEMTYSAEFNHVFNIHRNGSRINVANNDEWHGLATAHITYWPGTDDNSTPNGMTLSTLDKTGSTAGTAITYRLVVSKSNPSAFTLSTNKVFGSAGTTSYESFSSEIIITEIAQ